MPHRHPHRLQDEAKISQAISAGAAGYLLKTSIAEELAAAIVEAFHGGSPMSRKVARSVGRLLAKLTNPAAPPVSLSPRERELLALLVEGLTVNEIADRPQVSILTTSTHTRNLFIETGVHRRAASAAGPVGVTFLTGLTCRPIYPCLRMVRATGFEPVTPTVSR